MWSDDLIRRGVLKLHSTPFVRCEVLNFRIPLSEQAETRMVHQYGKGDG